jgi:hypothetical protein
MFVGNLLLMAPQTGQSQQDPHNAAARMIELAERVELLGHHLKYLFPTDDAGAAGKLHDISMAIACKQPRAMLRIPVRSRADAYYLRWPKDGLQSFAAGVAIGKERVLAEICVRIGAIKTVYSAWCEGGLFSRTQEAILASSAARHARRRSKVVAGYSIHRVPQPSATHGYRDRCGLDAHGKTHIDLDCCLLQAPSGERLLILGEPYLQAYRRQIHVAATALAALVHVIPEREVTRRALNLISLPPNATIIPSHCPYMRGVLQEHFGLSGVVVAKIDRDFNYNNGIGGLGCMSSVIEPGNFDPRLL